MYSQLLEIEGFRKGVGFSKSKFGDRQFWFLVFVFLFNIWWESRKRKFGGNRVDVLSIKWKVSFLLGRILGICVYVQEYVGNIDNYRKGEMRYY